MMYIRKKGQEVVGFSDRQVLADLDLWKTLKPKQV